MVAKSIDKMLQHIIYFMGKLGLGEEFLKNHKTQISEK